MAEKYNINGVSVTKYTPDESQDRLPIIMVHGGDHAGWCWEKWAKLLCDAGYEVHVPDWYSHGDSDKLAEDEFVHRSIADVARQEITFVAEKLDRSPILIGHSMGGLASAVYASTASVDRLVLVAPVMPTSVHPDPIPLPVDMSQPYPIFPFEQAKQLFFTKSNDEDARSYYDRLTMESPQAVHEATRWTVDFDITAITIPTLVMAAEFDNLIPHDPLEHYAEMLHADYQEIKGIGHSDILLKEPEWREAAEAVRDWLQNSPTQ